MRSITFNVVLYSAWVGFVSLMYLCTVALTNRKSDEISWKEHYYGQRVWFFSILVLTIIAAILVSFFFFGASFLHPYRALQLSLLLMAIVAIVTDRQVVHEVVSVLFLLFFLVGSSFFRFVPDLFAS